MPFYDLHCHSTCSDGRLTPHEVVARAASRGVGVLALTDHDELAGLEDADAAAHEHGIQLVNGVEISVSWEGHTIHLVGLGIDAGCATLADGLAGIRAGRSDRARRMADALAECGIGGVYEGARKYVGEQGLMSRTHVARYLVESGHARDVKSVFNRFLTPGKPGYVAHRWASLPDAVTWIHTAGGQAVLAHPARYAFARSTLRRLLSEFRDLRGDAIEVMSGTHTGAEAAEFATLARVYGLLASTGSDFHAPDESAVELGGLPPLPLGTMPIWQHW
jgi:predicted metal-dependent phosphoesterase TrpH